MADTVTAWKQPQLERRRLSTPAKAYASVRPLRDVALHRIDVVPLLRAFHSLLCQHKGLGATPSLDSGSG